MKDNDSALRALAQPVLVAAASTSVVIYRAAKRVDVGDFLQGCGEKARRFLFCEVPS